MFKLNSNKKVILRNKGIIFPGEDQKTDQENIRTIAFRQSDLVKLAKLRAKYKISRSAIIRILLDNIQE